MPRSTLDRMVLLLAVPVVLGGGCATITRYGAREHERMLAAAGFRIHRADMPELQEDLPSMPPHQLVSRTKNGKVRGGATEHDPQPVTQFARSTLWRRCPTEESIMSRRSVLAVSAAVGALALTVLGGTCYGQAQAPNDSTVVQSQTATASDPVVFETLTVRKEDAVLFAEISAPPMNLLGPELVRDLAALIQRAEADDTIQVLVFKSAEPDYFISHVDVTRINEYREEAAKLTGEASIALLFRHLSASRLVTIAQIEGRVRGAGSEFVLACDMRFAALESAIFGQPEPGLGGIPAGAACNTSRPSWAAPGRSRLC